MSNAREETIRVVLFDGKATTWLSCKENFLARANKKGYKKILQKKVEVIKETETIPDTDPDKKEKIANRETERECLRILDPIHRCLERHRQNNLIKNTKSDDYPDDNAGNVWKALEKKFEPKTAPSKAK